MNQPAVTAAVQAAPLDLTKPVVDRHGLRRALGSQWGTIAKALPKHFTQERFFALLLGQATKDAKLLQCTGVSILNAVLQAASLGLEVNAATGEAYLIPYKDTRGGKTVATFVPGYKGLAKLAMQSPSVLGMSARLAYEGEHFEVHYGTRDEIIHVPNFDVERTADRVVAAYAIAKMQGGVTLFEAMTRKQLDVLRARSLEKTRGQGPWTTDTEEMYRKTPVRRLCKLLPLTAQLADALEAADRAETGEIEVERARRSAAADALNAATSVALSVDCSQGCRIQDGEVIHSPECRHSADDGGDGRATTEEGRDG